jgi:hypothetical protein
MCSFSIVEFADIELTESLLFRKLKGDPLDRDDGEPMGGLEVVLLSMVNARIR